MGHVCPQLQSNSHPECLPGLVIALEELANFGRAYAEQVIANAEALARVLDSSGLRVPGHGIRRYRDPPGARDNR